MLLEAAQNGQEGVVRLLLKKRTYAAQRSIETALHGGTENGHEAVVRLLNQHEKLRIGMR